MVSFKILTVATLVATVMASDSPIVDGYHSGLTNSQQTMDTLIRQLRANDGHPTSDIISAVITGLDSQIDNGIATVVNTLAPLTGGLSLAVGQALLGPFAQSVTNGAEVVISNLVGAPIDFITQGIRLNFANTLGNLATTAKQYNVDTTRLHQLSMQLRTNTHAKTH
ncbi:uncharacterized protein SAPINGB_P000968 [Magnusiomyces paraingens]|uniref:Uncharacterized protein n=1 Tax=Magnusiomyces paraingens TaxID=2606893 RepID=A0A5E8B528_9ASCO|nr:uncharacterized protein SAPINGB_P000968 [Saprochaete ingens]VVT45942.1 unnamed protein product [Saprochaete ingens]